MTDPTSLLITQPGPTAPDFDWSGWFSRYRTTQADSLIQEIGQFWDSLELRKQNIVISFAFKHKQCLHIDLLSQYIDPAREPLLQQLYYHEPSNVISLITYHLAILPPEQYLSYFKELKEAGADLAFPGTPDICHPLYHLLPFPEVIREMVKQQLWSGSDNKILFGKPPKNLREFILQYASPSALEICGLD